MTTDAAEGRFAGGVEGRLSSKLRQCKLALVEQWTERVLGDRRLSKAHRLAPELLIDGIPELIDGIIRTLDAEGEGDWSDVAGLDLGMDWSAQTRAEAGYSLADVLHEIAHLRATIIDVCFDEHRCLELRELRTIHAILDSQMCKHAVAMENVAREALEEREARLRLATQAGKVGIWDYDPRTGELRWDERCRALVGVAPDAAVDYEVFRSTVHPEDLARVEHSIRCALDPALGGEGEYSVEYRIVDARGEGEKWVLAQGRVSFDSSGRAVRLMGTVIDTSERKYAEVERVQELAFRDRFMGILGHDLRTPLTSILLSTASLRHGEQSEGQEKTIRRIAGSAERMARMIDDLLDLTRSQLGGGIPIVRTVVDLDDVCRRAIEEFEGVRASVPIRLEIHGRTTGVWDANRITQLVSNLVGNALDYSASEMPVRVSVHGHADDVVLEVHNHGPVIPPDAMASIFDPFLQGAQVGRAGTRRGLGLGLFIARQIAQAHGGSIDVASAPELGTTFVVRLPRSD